MQVMDAAGKMIVEYKNLSKEKGINRAVWNLSQEGARVRRPPTPEQLEFAGPPRGPQVVPGIYIVKLFVGAKAIGETKVEVRVDPTVQVTPVELQAQYDLAMRLRDQVSIINDGMRQLDSIKTQADNIEAVAKDRLTEVPTDLTKAFADFKKKLNDLLESMSANPEDNIRASTRYADQLNGLYFTVGGGNHGPTRTMRENYEELTKEFPSRVQKINQFVSIDATEFNKVLARSGLGPIFPGRAIEPPK